MRVTFIAAMLTAIAIAPTSAQDWSGWYGGFSAGVLAGGYDDEYGMHLDNSGVSVGAFGGYRHSLGTALVGIEASGQVSAVRSTSAANFGLPDVNYGSVGRLGARASLAAPVRKFLPYVALGAAWNFQHYTPFAGRQTTVGHPSIEAAVGLDYALTDLSFGRIEANYSALTSENYQIGFGPWHVAPQGVIEVKAGIGFLFR